MRGVWFVVALLTVTGVSEVLPTERHESLRRAPSGGQAIRAECSGEIQPDRVVIVGGITAQSLKPTEARAQLDRQLEEARQYVSAQGGMLTLGERVRAVRVAGRRHADRDRDDLPFMMLQRLEAEFPADADVDVILERLLQLGLDRFGRKVQIEPRRGGPKPVVHYRVSALEEKLDEVHRRCQAEAVRRWCEIHAAAERDTCARALDTLSRHLVTRAFTLESQPVLRAAGGFAPVRLSYPWRKAELSAVELLGRVVLRLHGTIVVVLPGATR